MAYLVATGNVPQAQELRGLKQSLILSFNYAHNVKRQLDQMTDQQVTDQFGIPIGSVPAFRTNVDGVVTALDAVNIQNVMASLGFSA